MPYLSTAELLFILVLNVSHTEDWADTISTTKHETQLSQCVTPLLNQEHPILHVRPFLLYFPYPVREDAFTASCADVRNHFRTKRENFHATRNVHTTRVLRCARVNGNANHLSLDTPRQSPRTPEGWGSQHFQTISKWRRQRCQPCASAILKAVYSTEYVYELQATRLRDMNAVRQVAMLLSSIDTNTGSVLLHFNCYATRFDPIQQSSSSFV